MQTRRPLHKHHLLGGLMLSGRELPKKLWCVEIIDYIDVINVQIKIKKVKRGKKNKKKNVCDCLIKKTLGKICHQSNCVTSALFSK